MESRPKRMIEETLTWKTMDLIKASSCSSNSSIAFSSCQGEDKCSK
jgi:hypothetical protein